MAILVVDDDLAIQEMPVELLSTQGYACETCRDGRQVLEVLEQKKIELLILDVLIPHMNGFALIDRIRSHPTFAQLPVIMISGIYRSRNHRKQMISSHNVLDYLDKPLKLDHLLQLVGSILTPGAPAPPPETKPPSERRQSIPPAEILEPDARLVDQAARKERDEVEDASRKEFKTNVFMLQGNLGRRPVAALFGMLWRDRRTGALLLRHEKIKKIIYFKNGEPLHVKSNLVSECLGKLLMSQRLITEEECAESVRMMKESGKKQGEVLISMRCLTRKNVEYALELQLETKLFETFTWEQGEYRFNGSAQTPEIENNLEWKGPALVVEGIRRTFDETRLRKLMLSTLDVPLTSNEPNFDFTTAGFTKSEQKAINSVHFPQTTRELLDTMPTDPPDTLRILYTLIALEILVPN